MADNFAIYWLNSTLNIHGIQKLHIYTSAQKYKISHLLVLHPFIIFLKFFFIDKNNLIKTAQKQCNTQGVYKVTSNYYHVFKRT